MPDIGVPQTPTRAPRQRPCLRCDRVFVSTGPHHRLCERCREHNATASQAPAYPVHVPREGAQ